MTANDYRVPSPYYIFAPDYRDDSAGVRVLHRLCDALNKVGHKAYITAQQLSPKLNTPQLTAEVEQMHRNAGLTPITIYPEVVTGNPRKAPVVVRYLLNRPGLLAGDRLYADSELIFAYRQEFVPAGMQTETLYLPTSDLNLFNPFGIDETQRKGTCFYTHRYLKWGGRLSDVTSNSLELSPRHPRSLQELAEIFRHSELLYAYESSALCREAMLCGCPVVYLPNEYLTQIPAHELFGTDGAAWGCDAEEIARAKATVGKVYDRYLELKAVFWQQLDGFIALTQLVADEYEKANEIRLQQHGLGQSSVILPVMLPALRVDDGLPDYRDWQLSHSWSVKLVSRMREAWQDFDQAASLHLAVIVPPGLEHAFARTLASMRSQWVGEWHLSVLARSHLAEGEPGIPHVTWTVSDDPLTDVNKALMTPGYDWVGMIEAGDLLPEHALFTLAHAIAKNRTWGMLYSDEDSVDADGVLGSPYFKPDFSPELLHSAPFALGGLLLLRQDIFSGLGGFRPEMEGIEYYDLALRAYACLGNTCIGHIPDILYHRSVEGGHCFRELGELVQARERALSEHLHRLNLDAVLGEGLAPGTYRLRYQCPGQPLVSIIIPSRNGGEYLQRNIGALIENTEYKHWEVVVVDLSSDDPATLDFLNQIVSVGGDQAKVVTVDKTLSVPTAQNFGASAARGEFLMFLSDACAALRGDWLDEMLGFASSHGVGVVGGRMIGPDGKISHAGYLLGYQGKPAALHSLHTPMDDPGYFGRLHLPHNPAAVSSACMMVNKSLFDELGGFDAVNLPTAYSDVDFCLRVRETGQRIVWTPHAILFHEHADGHAENDKGEVNSGKRIRHLSSPVADVMYDRWLQKTSFDPSYNRNLSLTKKAYDIETIPLLIAEPSWRPLPRILAHPADRSGCGEYRVIAPMRNLINAGVVQGLEIGSHFSVPELVHMSPDSIIFQRQIEWQQFVHMEEYRRYAKAFQIYELDDLITNIQLKNVARHGVQNSDLMKRFRKALSLCDRLVVSTQYLADQYSQYVDDVVVVPNFLELARWGELTPVCARSHKPRVGWAGSITHGGDLEIILDVVKATRDEIDWVFLGMCPADMQHLVKEFHPGVPLEEYPAKLASLNLDLAIAPLEDVPFNHGKSHLKVLEYGVLGYPVIASDITPYRGFPITLVRNRFKNWIDAIREHVADRDALAARGDILREHIKANWMLDDHLDVWLKAWLPY
jgi:GT2 family glycosyltransferase/glycosyltransferase involved in cell wall biosynthesis